MSHNENEPERSARNHMPAIIAIVVAIVVAGLAFMYFSAAEPPADDATQSTVVEEVTGETPEAGGLPADGVQAPTEGEAVSPEPAAPSN